MILKSSRSHFAQQLRSRLDRCGGFDVAQPIYLYGAATVGKMVLKRCREQGVAVLGFFDGNKALWGKKVEGIRVLSPEALETLAPASQVVIASIIYESEIAERLKVHTHLRILPLSLLSFFAPKAFDTREYRERFDSMFRQAKSLESARSFWSDKESKRVYDLMVRYRAQCYHGCDPKAIASSHPQYFEPGVISLSKDEIFVDGGAFIGDTMEEYLKVSPSCREIHSFEPDGKNFKKLRATAARLQKGTQGKLVAVNRGLYSKTSELWFYALSTSTSLLMEEHDFGTFQGQSEEEIKKHATRIPVVSIDEYFAGRTAPTFIKLDVEGSEVEALKGAKKTIAQFKPKLAICVYHKAADLWQIPHLIKKLNPSYKLYLRHYSLEVCETICYAV